MDRDSIIERFIVDELMMESAGTKLDPDVSLIEGGILDSLGILRLVSFLEKRFGITIEDGELVPESCGTLNAISELVAGKAPIAQG